MKKNRRFSVSENASVLSAEEMRRISGGGSTNCISSQCEVYIDGGYSCSGSCVEYNGGCSCKVGDYYYDATGSNENYCQL